MGFPLALALRYMRSKKRSFVSVGTMFAILGVALGVAALATVISVTGGFRKQFRDKVLGVNAHVLVLKYTSDFREYRDVMEDLDGVPGVTGIAPFVINPMMVTHGKRTATGVLLKGVDPTLMPRVLDLPRHVVEGSMAGLRRPGATPPKRPTKAKGATLDARRGALNGEPATTLDKSSAAELAANDPIHGFSGPIASADPPSQRVGPVPDQGSVGTKDAESTDWVASLPSDAPVGAITPEGGYAAELPEDDYLPPELDTDPCADPVASKQLPGIVVGKTLRENLELKLGDCVQVTSPTIGYTFAGGSIRAPVAKQFRVVAVFDAGFDQYDSRLVYTDLYEAQAFYDAGDTVTGVEMKVSDIDNARKIAEFIDRKLSGGIYRVMDWEELNHGLFTALRIQQIMMSLVLALIIIVAAFTVVATLIMVVLDKKRDIAVLKSMGAGDSALLRVFLYQGAIIGVVGTAIGLAFGWTMCKVLLVYGFPLDPKVYFISRLPVDVKPEQFVLVGVFAILVCLCACVWPALHAARLRPTDAFREQQ